MTEPPRPPGEGAPGQGPEPTSPPPPPASYSAPGEAPGPPGQYGPPPSGYQAPPGTYQSGGYQPGGYQQGGYQPSGYQPGGYPPGGYAGGPGAPPPGYPSNDDKTWALIAHFGGALGMLISGGFLGFIAPLVAYMAKGQQSPAVRAHALAALNFQLLWSIIGLVSLIIGCLLLFIPTLIVTAVGVIFGIIAGVKANEGQLYRYPMSVSFIK